jgi:hypothetical protein
MFPTRLKHLCAEVTKVKEGDKDIRQSMHKMVLLFVPCTSVEQSDIFDRLMNIVERLLDQIEIFRHVLSSLLLLSVDCTFNLTHVSTLIIFDIEPVMIFAGVAYCEDNYEFSKTPPKLA